MKIYIYALESHKMRYYNAQSVLNKLCVKLYRNCSGIRCCAPRFLKLILSAKFVFKNE